MHVADFDFPLPPELIAQAPLPERDASRLLTLSRSTGAIAHRMVRGLPSLLRAGDVLVVNDARVIPARLHGKKRDTGGKVELLLVEPFSASARGQGARDLQATDWLAIGGSSKPLRQGAVVDIGGQPFTIIDVLGGGEVRVRLPAHLDTEAALHAFLDEQGQLPLPPYIEREPEAADRERYQTLFAKTKGAIAAPTAGLHFTERLLAALDAQGVLRKHVTLHVGPGTFLPVRVDRTEDHRMHRERYDVPADTAQTIAAARAQGHRVIAVGTTALRTLEAAFDPATRAPRPGPGSTDLFCTPGYDFRAVDALFTNFHLPKSTLVMLVAAFAGLDHIKAAYAAAVAERYRFFSYGDAMLIA
ncbi:MAG: tRNA preQ1(34) S-adenosylmethionine ribosyltransferase-isomerase QueA [Deltaproteobacteria bacterium]|nr:tRNA preQ1(34) S-adenosylmethionine ribosyltransferase-isomerase QueA [Deltaproteobacteria bacterium]